MVNCHSSGGATLWFNFCFLHNEGQIKEKHLLFLEQILYLTSRCHFRTTLSAWEANKKLWKLFPFAKIAEKQDGATKDYEEDERVSPFTMTDMGLRILKNGHENCNP